MSNVKNISGYNEDLKLKDRVDEVYRQFGIIGKDELNDFKEEIINRLVDLDKKFSNSDEETATYDKYRAVSMTANEVGAYIIKCTSEPYLEVMILRLQNKMGFKEIGSLKGVTGSRAGSMMRQCEGCMIRYITAQARLNKLLEMNEDYVSRLEVSHITVPEGKSALMLLVKLDAENREYNLKICLKRRVKSYITEGLIEELYNIVRDKLFEHVTNNRRYYYPYTMKSVKECLGTVDDFKDSLLQAIPSNLKKPEDKVMVTGKTSRGTTDKEDIKLLVNYIKSILPKSILETMTGSTDREGIVGYVSSLHKE